MAGPRPMPNQPPGYQQQYAPPGGYQQPPYPQKKGSSGIMKGCIIAFVVIFILGLLFTLFVGGAVWFGATKLSEATAVEFDSAEKVSNEFLQKLAAGDVKGAHAKCESTISEPQLAEFYRAYEQVLKDNKGVTYNSVEAGPVKIRGNYSSINGDTTISLNGADVNGQKGVQITFQVRKQPGSSDYRIRYVAITGFTPSEGGGVLGDFYNAPASSRHD